jgi:hypothetical protein
MNVESDLLDFWGVGVSAGWQYDGAAGTCPSRQMHEGCMLGARSSQSASFEAPWAGRDRSLNAPFLAHTYTYAKHPLLRHCQRRTMLWFIEPSISWPVSNHLSLMLSKIDIAADGCARQDRSNNIDRYKIQPPKRPCLSAYMYTTDQISSRGVRIACMALLSR